jgi:DNA polymerase-3 subunit beta
MRVSIDAPQLARGVATVSRSVPARTTMPVLTGMLLEADASGLRLVATDLEVTCTVTVAAEVHEAGRAVVPARLFAEIVRRVPTPRLDLVADPDRADAVLSWERSEFRLHGFGPDQFPEPAAAPAGTEFTSFSEGGLRDTLRHTAFAAASEAGGRPILTGVELTLLDGDYRAVATDGMRVAYFRTAERTDWARGMAVTLPGRGVDEIVRSIEAAGGQGAFCAHENHMFVRAGTTEVAVRLLEGRFPAILDLVPKQFPTTVRLDASELRDACERVALVTDAPDRLHAITLVAGADGMEVRARSPEVGEARESVAAGVEGPDTEFAVNARMLLEGLRHLSDGELQIEFSGPQSLARLKKADDARLQYMQMPLRLGS